MATDPAVTETSAILDPVVIETIHDVVKTPDSVQSTKETETSDNVE